MEIAFYVVWVLFWGVVGGVLFELLKEVFGGRRSGR
jgi:uncharacterized membrane protein YuzA (DUF378 family)